MKFCEDEIRYTIIKWLTHRRPSACEFLPPDSLLFLPGLQKRKESTQFFSALSSLLVPTTKTIHLPSYFLNSVLSGTKHISWPKIMQEELTVDRDVPLPDDICNFTEVSQILIALMLWGSKSEYKIWNQAKKILPTLVVWHWHSVAVICLSGRWQRWGQQTEEPY